MSMIAYCGLDCERCDAYLATVRDDDALREKTAKLWTELNGVPITKDMIHCLGCCGDGVKTPFCDSLCAIRQCALQKVCASCGDCAEKQSCGKLSMITATNAEARERLGLR